jgi:hypothetical protein
MNGNASRFVRVAVGLLGLVTLGSVLTSQAAKPTRHGIHLATDWSHRHLIFSQPRTADEATRLQQDPRFEQQWARRNQRLSLANDGTTGTQTPPRFYTEKPKMHRDWATPLGIGATVGAGNFPAKFSFDSETADCNNDFVVFGTDLLGTNTQATIIAYNNLYGGCAPSTVPSVLWSYNTTGRAVTSPVFSRDGTQVAFVQTFPSGPINLAELVLVKWAPAPLSSVGSPAPLAGVNEPLYRGCPTCYTTVLLHAGSNLDDTTSSPFYDYTNDIMWVGSEEGWLHKIRNVFLTGIPAEQNGGGFPAHVSTVTMYSPVYDHVSGNVFVEDVDGFLYSVNATTGAIIKSGQLDFSGQISEGPIVDSSNGKVYVFASSDGSDGVCGLGIPCSAVYQLSTSFAANDTGTKVTAGTSGAGAKPMYTGGFDNAYYSSLDGTGNLYVCGNTGLEPTLYQVPITAGALPVASQSLVKVASTGSVAGCSPVTDVLNPGDITTPASERLFVGVQDNGLATGCIGNAGCLQSYPVTAWKASATYTIGQQVLDSGLNIEVVTAGGTAGLLTPVWSPVVGTPTLDGATVTWLNQGPLLPSAPLWQPNHPYGASERIFDGLGNLQAATNPGFSDLTTPPVWNTTVGGTTIDGLVIWTNVGPSTLAALPSEGGTSGIIIDNTVVNGIVSGTSQIYFSTLTDKANCGTGTGTGCAIQASQSALQ